jgi:hypothetical protein
VSQDYYDEFNRKRTFREILRSAPRRVRVLTWIGLGLAAGAVVYAVGFGVYSLFWFNHREYADCRIVSLDGPHFARNEYWNVASSCGTYAVNYGDFLAHNDAATLIQSLQPTAEYRITFEGWGPGREIVAARRIDPIVN